MSPAPSSPVRRSRAALERLAAALDDSTNSLDVETDAAPPPEISVVMPCLNEEESVGFCVTQALEGIRRSGRSGEVVVCDNGSHDESVAKAVEAGARVVHQPQRGYGSAYRKGFDFARGQYLVMGDSDGSYDFSELDKFVKILDEGNDYVLGSRFGGTILPGAMPWLHRYIGNPVLTAVLNRFFGLNASDAHSGMRAFTRDAYDRLGLATEGMEFASEIVINAAHAGLKVAEVPITYHPRIGESKLHSFRDGWRHLRFMLLLCPKYLFLLPGLAMLLLGAVGSAALAFGPVQINGLIFDLHWNLLFTMLAILGYQSIWFGLLTKAYARQHRHGRRDWALEVVDRHFSLERGLVVGGLLLVVGLVINATVLTSWLFSARGELNAIRPVLVAMTLLTIGMQTAFGSFFLSLLGDRSKARSVAPTG